MINYSVILHAYVHLFNNIVIVQATTAILTVLTG